MSIWGRVISKLPVLIRMIAFYRGPNRQETFCADPFQVHRIERFIGLERAPSDLSVW